MSPDNLIITRNQQKEQIVNDESPAWVVPQRVSTLILEQMLRAGLDCKRALKEGRTQDAAIAEYRYAAWSSASRSALGGYSSTQIASALTIASDEVATDTEVYPDAIERATLAQILHTTADQIRTAEKEDSPMPALADTPQQRTAPVTTHHFPVVGGYEVIVRCEGLSDCVAECSVPECGWSWSDFSEPVSCAAAAVHAITHHTAVPDAYLDFLADVVEPRIAARVNDATAATEQAAEKRILKVTTDRNALRDKLRDIEAQQTRIEARRYDNTILRGEVTRADQKAGLLSAVVVPATGAAVATGMISALPIAAQITGWAAAAGAGAIAALLVAVIRPRLAAGGTVGAVSARPDTTEEIVVQLDAQHAELSSITAAKNRRLSLAFKALVLPASLTIVALALAGLGW